MSIKLTEYNIANIKTIYDMLEDQESKDIYLSTFNYLITGNWSYICNIVETYLPDFPVLKNGNISQLLANLSNNEMVYIYGAGCKAKNNISVLKKYLKSFIFCDNDLKKQESGFYGYDVISVEKMISIYNGEKIIITPVMQCEEIYNELRENGIDNENIIKLSEYYCVASENQYFGMNFIKYQEEEIFVDAGCANLSTTVRLNRKCNLKKVYAFEPDPSNFKECIFRKETEKLDFVKMFPYGDRKSVV